MHAFLVPSGKELCSHSVSLNRSKLAMNTALIPKARQTSTGTSRLQTKPPDTREDQVEPSSCVQCFPGDPRTHFLAYIVRNYPTRFKLLERSCLLRAAQVITQRKQTERHYTPVFRTHYMRVCCERGVYQMLVDVVRNRTSVLDTSPYPRPQARTRIVPLP